MMCQRLNKLPPFPDDVDDDARRWTADEDDRLDETDAEDVVVVVVWPSPPLSVVLSESNDPWKGPFERPPATEEDAALELKPANVKKVNRLHHSEQKL